MCLWGLVGVPTARGQRGSPKRGCDGVIRVLVQVPLPHVPFRKCRHSTFDAALGIAAGRADSRRRRSLLLPGGQPTSRNKPPPTIWQLAVASASLGSNSCGNLCGVHHANSNQKLVAGTSPRLGSHLIPPSRLEGATAAVSGQQLSSSSSCRGGGRRSRAQSISLCRHTARKLRCLCRSTSLHLEPANKPPCNQSTKQRSTYNRRRLHLLAGRAVAQVGLRYQNNQNSRARLSLQTTTHSLLRPSSGRDARHLSGQSALHGAH